ncbi:MAG: signal recognition particle-docking protein FtsY [Pseudomonadota bacterium]
MISFFKKKEAEVAPAAPKKSWWQRLSSGLSRTSQSFSNDIAAIFTRRRLDAETIIELEDLLIRTDLGLDMAAKMTVKLKAEKFDKDISAEDVKQALAEDITNILAKVAQPFVLDETKKPHVVLVIGVNGSGKTTTIGKLASIMTAQGKKVMLAAGDTFRAAAIEQLKIWGARTNAQVIAKEHGADAAALAYEAFEAAARDKADLLIIDTAGRLQNRTELMAELEKIIRVLKKRDASAPHSVILTLDATTGQNALNQADIFGKTCGVTGLVMTKLDGTARGGILVAVADKYKLPIHFIGVGEGIDDLEPFAAEDFAKALVGIE